MSIEKATERWLFSLQALFAVKGAALGLAGGVCTGAADVHAGCHTFEILIIGAVDGIALNVGLGLGRGVAGDHVAVIFSPLGKAVAAGIALAVGVGAVHLDAFPDTQFVLIVGAAADVTSQIAHDFIFLSHP